MTNEYRHAYRKRETQDAFVPDKDGLYRAHACNCLYQLGNEKLDLAYRNFIQTLLET